MDFDLFFSSPRWKVLEVISNRPSSPLEISKKLNTSVAYISQQLKLLEAANLVKKEKTGSSEKGKPRNIYSLAKEILPLTVLMNKLPRRKVIELDDHHKIILRIWLIEDTTLHYSLEKLFWKLEPSLEDIEGIFFDSSSSKNKILIISEEKKLSQKILALKKEFKEKLDIAITSKSAFSKLTHDTLYEIYDPYSLGEIELKGGEEHE